METPTFVFNGARELIDALSPLAEWKQGFAEDLCIFRGQASAGSHLIPRVHREDKENGRTEPWGPGADIWRQANSANGEKWSVAWTEFDAMQRFIESCDRQGISLPGDSAEARNAYWSWNARQNLERTGYKAWPFREHLPILALAQHYGFPTRLLDWTMNPLVAAYFAARDAAVLQCAEDAPPKEEQLLAIWAFDPVSEIKNRTCRAGEVYLYPPIGGDNPNLGAQQGVLTVVRGQEPTSDGHWLGLDEVFETSDPCIYPLRKLTLPWTRAAQLLSLLSNHMIDGATMFPGIAGAVRLAQEHYYWQVPRESLLDTVLYDPLGLRLLLPRTKRNE